MKSKRTGMLILIIVIAVACVLGGLYAGMNIKYRALREELVINARINIGELEGLGDIKGPIYVTGHKNPDTDTICSAIAFAELFQLLGYDTQPVILDSVNKETAFILKTAGVDVPPLLEDMSGKNVILMDHSDINQDLDTLTDANILCVVDHHGVGNITTTNPIIYDARPLGATATIVWVRARNYGLVPDKETATILLGAILSDTSNLKSASTTIADKEAVRILSKIAKIQDVDTFYDEMHKEFLSHEGMTDEEIFFNDYKEYEAGGKKFGIGVVDCYDEEEVKDLAERMKKVMPKALEGSDVDMALAQVGVFNDKVSVTYLVPRDEAAEEAIKTAFGDKLSHEGSAYVLRPGVSRRKVLVPALKEVLEAHPKE